MEKTPLYGCGGVSIEGLYAYHSLYYHMYLLCPLFVQHHPPPTVKSIVIMTNKNPSHSCIRNKKDLKGFSRLLIFLDSKDFYYSLVGLLVKTNNKQWISFNTFTTTYNTNDRIIM